MLLGWENHCALLAHFHLEKEEEFISLQFLIDKF